jgi:5-methylcytosine-specific restriction endonuclease McrA
VLARSGLRCEGCDRHQDELVHPLQIHHRNGLRSDSTLENLASLCERCHLQADRAMGIWR